MRLPDIGHPQGAPLQLEKQPMKNVGIKIIIIVMLTAGYAAAQEKALKLKPQGFTPFKKADGNSEPVFLEISTAEHGKESSLVKFKLAYLIGKELKG